MTKETNITYYMHPYSGVVMTKEEWRADYESMDDWSWYGEDVDRLEMEDAWLDGLIEVVRDKNGNWIEA